MVIFKSQNGSLRVVKCHDFNFKYLFQMIIKSILRINTCDALSLIPII